MFMIETTISLQNSGSYNDIQTEHDNREKDENGQPYFSKNVDESLSENNWYWEGNKSIMQFYNETFEEAYKAQTEKIRKTHPERLEGRKSSYYEQILSEQLEAESKIQELKKEGMKTKDINKQMSATTKVAYQTIVQFGDRDSIFGTLKGTPEGREIAKKVMSEFFEKWQKEYPNMKIINAVIHCDEVGKDREGGTVHMHITYCPVAQNYKKGQTIRNSLTTALKEMGFESDKKKNQETGEFQFAIEKWQQSMRDDLQKMLEKYEITRLKPEETRTGHESTADYQKRKDQKTRYEKQKQQIKEQETIIEKQEKTIQENKEVLEDLQEDVEDSQRLIKQAEEKVNELYNKKNEYFDIINNAEKQMIQALVPPEPPEPHKHYTKKKLFGKSEEVYEVPVVDYYTLEKQNYFHPQKMLNEIKSLFNSIRQVFNSLPVFQQIQEQTEKFIQRIKQLENTVSYLKNLILQKDEKIKSLEHEKAILDNIRERFGDEFVEDNEPKEEQEQREERTKPRNIIRDDDELEL